MVKIKSFFKIYTKLKWNSKLLKMQTMEQHAFKKCKQLFEYFDYLEISGGQSSDLYLNVVHFSTAMLIRHLRLLKTVVFLHWCPIRALLLLEYQSHILV
jgi:hypothetical protein